MALKPEELMMGALTTTYAHPTNVTYRESNNSYKYYGILQIKDKDGKAVKTYVVNAPVTGGTQRVITAWPSRK
jgi:hypothetical protein